MENYYKILDVHPKASQAEIKERYRFLANAYHPDKFATSEHKNRAEEQFKKINQAYQVLSVPAKRADYDRKLGLISPATRSNNGSRSRQAGQSRDVFAVGQSIIRTIAFIVIILIISQLAARVGIGGLVMFLVLLAIIYAKYFWK